MDPKQNLPTPSPVPNPTPSEPQVTSPAAPPTPAATPQPPQPAPPPPPPSPQESNPAPMIITPNAPAPQIEIDEPPATQGPVTPAGPVATPPASPGGGSVPQSQPQPQSRPTGPMTQADFMALTKKDRNPKKLFAVLGAVFVLIGTVAILHFTGIFPLTPFRTISYDNGKESVYKLQFYSKHKVDKPDDFEKQFGDINVLTSKKGKGGKAPIRVLIQDEDSKTLGGSGFLEMLSNCNKQEPAVKTYNKASKKEVAVCDFTSILGGFGGGSNDQIKDMIYSSYFEQDGRTLVVVIMSTAINEEAMTSPSKAKDALEKSKLSVYKEDIAKIVGSIKIEKHKEN